MSTLDRECNSFCLHDLALLLPERGCIEITVIQQNCIIFLMIEYSKVVSGELNVVEATTVILYKNPL